VDDMLLTCERLILASIASSLFKSLDPLAQGRTSGAFVVVGDAIEIVVADLTGTVDDEIANIDQDAFVLVLWPLCFVLCFFKESSI